MATTAFSVGGKAHGGGVSTARRYITLALLMLVAVLSYVDRQIFTLFQDDIKVELGLGDGQLGVLTGLSFAAFYALAAFPIARYSDHGDRRMVISVGPRYTVNLSVSGSLTHCT